MPRRKPPVIADPLPDQILGGAGAKSAFEAEGLLGQLKKALAERVLNAGMDHHLVNGEPGNSRNGYGRKTVTTGSGRIGLEIPRDRAGSFDPALIARYQRRFPGFDEKIIPMYARGMAVVDGLKGFPEAITAVFPDAMVQTCIVHLLRHSLDFVSYKDRKTVAVALKEICKAVDAGAGLAALNAFEASDWGRKYPAIARSWRRAWAEVIPFCGFAGDVRRIICTTNAIGALNARLRRAVRARGHFPNDDAATKLLFLVLNRAGKEWTMPPREWAMAKAQFAVLFGERFTRAMA